MNYFIVYAHPEPKSFNGGLKEAVVERLKAADHTVTVSDLYAMEWDPRGDERDFLSVENKDFFKYQLEQKNAAEKSRFAGEILAEQEKLLWCDALIFIFPLWWFSLPAILKGWVDRVFATGFSYGGGMWYDKGRFVGKKALLALTTGGSEDSYREDGINGDMEKILYHINHGILYFNGFDVVEPFITWGAAHIDDETRKEKINQFCARVLDIDSQPTIRYPKLENFDERLILKKD